MSVTNDIVALIYFMSGGQYMINLLNIADLSIVAFAGVIFAFAVTCVAISMYIMVGLSGLEPLTSRLSGVRSNQLSYRPILWWRRGESNS